MLQQAFEAGLNLISSWISVVSFLYADLGLTLHSARCILFLLSC